MGTGRAGMRVVVWFAAVLKAHGALDAFGWLSNVDESVMPLCPLTSTSQAMAENLLQTNVNRNMEIAKTTSPESLHSRAYTEQLMPEVQQHLPNHQPNANLVSSFVQDRAQKKICIPEIIPSFHAAFGMSLLAMLCVGLLCWMLVISCEIPEEAQASQNVEPVSVPSPNMSSIGKPHSDRKSKPILKCLDGLRTFLVTWIILSHMDGLPAGVGNHWPVHYFFVLSGFIMFYVVEGKRSQFDWRAGRAFVARRVARLCPVYFLALLWMAAAGYRRGENLHPFSAWLAQALLLQSLFPLEICGMTWNFRLDYGGNTVGWFTSASVLLSICFPLLYNHRSFHSGLRSTLYLLFAVLLVRSFIPLITFNFMYMHSWVLLRLPEYVAGMLSAQLCTQMPQSVVEWKGWGLIFDGSLLLGAGIVAAVLHSHDPRLVLSRQGHGDYFLTGIFCLTCIAACCAADSSTDKHQGLLHKVFSSWPMASMAEYSFSAYIMQTAVSKTLPSLFKTHAGDVVWKLIGIWILGIMVTCVLERPVLRLVERRLAGCSTSPRISNGGKRPIFQ